MTADPTPEDREHARIEHAERRGGPPRGFPDPHGSGRCYWHPPGETSTARPNPSASYPASGGPSFNPSPARGPTRAATKPTAGGWTMESRPSPQARRGDARPYQAGRCRRPPARGPARPGRTLPASIEPMLHIDDLAALLSCSRRLVERMRSAGKVPKPDINDRQDAHGGSLTRFELGSTGVASHDPSPDLSRDRP